MASLLPHSHSTSARCQRLCAQVLPQIQVRHASLETYRRTRKRSNIKPHPDFLPTKTEQHDHILFNPPPSLPNPMHTPSLFLPPNDPRKQFQAASRPLLPGEPEPTILKSGNVLLPPRTGPVLKRKTHCTAADLDEMRRLRKEDAMTWTIGKIAKKFDCSIMLVSHVTRGLARDKERMQRRVTEAVKSNWGTRRRIAREDRELRKEKWLRDE